MARLVYQEDIVNDALNKLVQVRNSLSTGPDALSSAIGTISGARGAEYISVDGLTAGISAASEMASSTDEKINMINDRVDTIQRYNQEYDNLPWLQKVFSTLGIANLQFFGGVLNAGEMIVDGFSTVVGLVGGIFSSEFKEGVSEFIATEHVNGWLNQLYETEDGQKMIMASSIDPSSTGGQVFKSLGTMAGMVATFLVSKAALGLKATAVLPTANTAKDLGLYAWSLAKDPLTLLSTAISGVSGLGTGTQAKLETNKAETGEYNLENAALFGAGNALKSMALTEVATVGLGTAFAAGRNIWNAHKASGGIEPNNATTDLTIRDASKIDSNLSLEGSENWDAVRWNEFKKAVNAAKANNTITSTEAEALHSAYRQGIKGVHPDANIPDTGVSGTGSGSLGSDAAAVGNNSAAGSVAGSSDATAAFNQNFDQNIKLFTGDTLSTAQKVAEFNNFTNRIASDGVTISPAQQATLDSIAKNLGITNSTAAGGAGSVSGVASTGGGVNPAGGVNATGGAGSTGISINPTGTGSGVTLAQTGTATGGSVAGAIDLTSRAATGLTVEDILSGKINIGENTGAVGGSAGTGGVQGSIDLAGRESTGLTMEDYINGTSGGNGSTGGSGTSGTGGGTGNPGSSTPKNPSSGSGTKDLGLGNKPSSPSSGSGGGVNPKQQAAPQGPSTKTAVMDPVEEALDVRVDPDGGLSLSGEVEGQSVKIDVKPISEGTGASSAARPGNSGIPSLEEQLAQKIAESNPQKPSVQVETRPKPQQIEIETVGTKSLSTDVKSTGVGTNAGTGEVASSGTGNPVSKPTTGNPTPQQVTGSQVRVPVANPEKSSASAPEKKVETKPQQGASVCSGGGRTGTQQVQGDPVEKPKQETQTPVATPEKKVETKPKVGTVVCSGSRVETGGNAGTKPGGDPVETPQKVEKRAPVVATPEVGEKRQPVVATPEVEEKRQPVVATPEVEEKRQPVATPAETRVPVVTPSESESVQLYPTPEERGGTQIEIYPDVEPEVEPAAATKTGTQTATATATETGTGTTNRIPTPPDVPTAGGNGSIESSGTIDNRIPIVLEQKGGGGGTEPPSSPSGGGSTPSSGGGTPTGGTPTSGGGTSSSGGGPSSSGGNGGSPSAPTGGSGSPTPSNPEQPSYDIQQPDGNSPSEPSGSSGPSSLGSQVANRSVGGLGALPSYEYVAIPNTGVGDGFEWKDYAAPITVGLTAGLIGLGASSLSKKKKSDDEENEEDDDYEEEESDEKPVQEFELVDE